MANENVLIVEDEEISATIIENRLEKYGYKVVGIMSKGEEAIDFVNENKVDIVLMDIMLSGDMNGIVAAKKIINQNNIPVVFLTAYSDEATLQKVIETSTYGYIVKPYSERELRIVIEIALKRYKTEQKKAKPRVNDLEGVIPIGGGYKKISIWNNDEIVLIDPNDLIYLEINNGVVILTTEKSCYSKRSTMLYWETKLAEYPFYRCHKNFMVNILKIKKIILEIDYTYSLKMYGSVNDIPLTRSKINELKKILML